MLWKPGALCLLLTMAPVVMRAQNGIAGTVKDSSGAILTGVVVVASSPALIEKTRTVLTDGSGQYKIVGLRPGTYSVNFSLPGFTPLQRDGIELTADFVADVNATLQVGAATQTVDVQEDISSLDVQSSTQQSVLPRAVMDDLPTGHSLFSDAQTLPGVTLSRPDVGGSSGMQQTTIQIHGAPTGDCVFEMDGMNISQLGSCSVGVYYNDGQIQETSYQTSAIPAETSAGGIVMNMIIKEGGNQFHGSFYGTGGTASMESNNVPASDIASGILKAGNHFSNAYDVNGSVGGPVIKDKLWFFSSVRRWGVNEYVANTFQPDGSQAIDDNRITEAMLRFDWQVTPKNKFSVFYDKDMKYRGHRRDTGSQAGGCCSYISSDAAVIQHTPLGYIAQANWTSVLSPKWVVQAGVSFFFLDYTYSYEPAVTSQSVSTLDLATSTETSAGEYLFRSIGARRTYVASTSYVSGSHNLKFGFQDSTGGARQAYVMNGDADLAFYNGVPDVAYLFNTPVDAEATLNADLGLYVQDSWTFHRLTVNAGARGEWLNASLPAQSVGPGTWVAARTYAPVPDLPNWKSIVPRIGLAYNLFGNGKTVIRASASKYDAQLNDNIALAIDPMFYTSETCTWNAPPGTTEAMMATEGITIMNESTFTKCSGFNGSVNTHVGSHYTRPFSWEYTFMVQQEILPQFIVSAGYYYRQNRNNLGVENIDAPPGDYTPYTITNPLTGTPMTIYNEAPADRGKIYDVLANYSQLNSDYNGFELQARKQFNKNGAFVFATLTIGRLYGSRLASSLSSTDLNNPDNLINSIGAIQMDATYQFHLNGTYTVPWGKIKLAGNYQHLSGQPFNPTYTVNTAVDPELTQLTQSIVLVKPGSERLPDLDLVDLRVSRPFRLGERWKFEPMADIYNLLNVNTPYTEVTTVGPNLGHYSANTEGRFLKAGLKVDF